MMQSVRISIAVAVLIAVLMPAVPRAQSGDPQFLEAKRLFDALDYENAVRALDQVIATLQARPVQDATRRDLLPSAFEMRGRSKFGLGDPNGAQADFVSLLKANPAYALTGQVSPRVVALFDAATRDTVTRLNLVVTPATAKIDVDGVSVAPGNSIPIAVGEHVVTVDQPGYRRAQQPLTAEVGKLSELSVTLERIASLVNISTVPFDVDVTIDGVKRGKTAGSAGAQASSVMVVSDLQPGTHLVEFTRDCYVRVEKRLSIDKPDDFVVGPVALEPAVANLTVRANEPGAQVYLDGQARGIAPFTTAELCEGDHTVELRSPVGRYVKRVQARSGDRIAVEGTVKPALALVSIVGQPAGSPDLRLVVERVFDASQTTTLFAPPVEQADQALRANQLPAGWLAFDANKRAVGGTADIVQPTMKRDASTRMASTFGSQGVAAITVVDRNRVVISLLAAGSGDPDVLDVSLDSQDSIAAAIVRLDRAPAFFRPSSGIVAVDVADVPGAVVLSADAKATAVGVRLGDIVTKVNGQAIADASALTTLLAGRKADDDLMLELKDRAGATKRADLKVFMTPRLMGISDQTLLANRMLLALRARLAGQNSPADEGVIRLNLAAALARVEAWSDARAELQRVKLPDGPGVSNGTVQYLLGVCADKLGNRADAETALKAAAATEALLTEDGPAVKDLAEARLAELQRPGGR
jgi:hypothetical protein